MSNEQPFDAAALLSGLNPEQAQAAQHFTGPALVIAGAGSGKTRTLIYRLAHLMGEHGVRPGEILAVTFTNKAAAEMRERAERLMPGAHGLWLSTFHSAGVRILRAYGERIGLGRGFVIFDDDDTLDLIKSVMRDVPGVSPDTNPRAVRGVIDRAKSNLQGAPDLAAGERYLAGIEREAMAEIFRRYEGRKRALNAIDFGDLITETVRLFRESPESLASVQRRARFIHVDEYQDTNRAQYELTRLLATGGEGPGNLLVVGDPDQSIYKFRGADIQNILDFQRDYSGAAVYRLEANYRSSAEVLGLANRLIAVNSERLEKVLRPVKTGGEPVTFHRASDHRAEADYVAERITALHHSGVSHSDMAILYRTNAQSRVLEESLRRVQIPAKIVGGLSFYDRREVRDILAYARLSVNPSDDVALRRIVGRPRRGIGDTSLEHLVRFAAQEGIPLLDACERAEEIEELRGADRVREFAGLMRGFSQAAESYGAAAFLRTVMDASGYLDMLRAEKGIEAEARLDNLEELVVAAEEWEQETGGSILDFLDESALLSSVDDRRNRRSGEDVPEETVTLMTLHNAKGLEFRAVFVVGVEEGLLPSKNALTERGGIEEERRLFYVGITRAMDWLFLTAAENRMTYGRTQTSEDSRFLEDIGGGFTPVDAYGHEVSLNRRSWQDFRPKVPAGRDGAVAAMKAAAPAPALGGPYKGGERVQHPKFGKGQVLAVSGSGERQEATVHFESVGMKKLLVRFANLQPAE